MSSRSSHVRTKVVALLLSLVALWGFAAVVTLRAGLNLLWVDTLDQRLDRPTESLITALQQERRLSLVYLSGRAPQQHAALTEQRARTDRARANFERLASGRDVQLAANDAAERHIKDALKQLRGIEPGRGAVDAGIVDRSNAAATFTDFINVGFRIYGSLATLDDAEVARRGRTLVRLLRAREVLSQEDALIAGMLAANRNTAAEFSSFAQLVGAGRFQYAETQDELPSAERTAYLKFASGEAAVKLRGLEDKVIAGGGTGALPVTADDWNSAVDAVFAELRGLENRLAESTVVLAGPAALAVIIRLVLAGGLGLIAVIASIVISISTVRSLAQQLGKLRRAALELAGERLPRVVERIREGEKVDVAVEAPPLAAGSDEVGQVAQAFNAVQETAIRIAVEQAELRRGVRDVFLNLARRTQTLVHRQLAVLDAVERREDSPEDLDDLFKVDHLATRMRRNAENLIVLSGAAPGRRWRNPVAFVDVIRGAIGEVEDYQRVNLLPTSEAALAGRAVGDVIHLLAELIENATSFSPPDTPVQVGGQRVANGYVVEIEDRGLGMSQTDRGRANEQLIYPPEFNLSSAAQLGLYVVGRLAERHGIRVHLRDSPYGGTLAIVLIPSALVVAEVGRPILEAIPQPEPEAGQEPAILAGVGNRWRPSLSEGSGPTHVPSAESAPTDLDVRSGITVATFATRPQRLDDPRPRRLDDPRLQRLDDPEPKISTPTPVTTLTADGVTRNGLPRRVRQANLAAPLRSDPYAVDGPGEPAGAGREPELPAGGRSPEQIRRMMSSYQRGTRQGRQASAGNEPDLP